MESTLVAHMLLCITSEDDKTLTKATLEAALPVVDKVIVFDTSPEDQKLEFDDPKISIIRGDPDYCRREGFAKARNVMIDASPEDCYIFWLDNDEVHFTDQLMQLKREILDPGKFTDVSMHFIHFVIGINFYQFFEKRRITIFRRTPGTKWVGSVHEKITHSPGERTIFFSDYVYHHYGYVRPQEYIFERWRQYALLDGSADTLDKQYPDKQCLEDRKARLMPYFGPYPETLPAEWIKSKIIYQ